MGTLGGVHSAVYGVVRRLNEVTPEEYAVVVATFLVVSEPAMRCEKCLAQFNDPKNSEHFRRNKLGCFGGDGKVFLKWAGVEFMTCPGNLFSFSVMEWIGFWNVWRNKGILPFQGGFAEQPAKVVDLFRLFDRLEEYRKESEAKRKALEGAADVGQ